MIGYQVLFWGGLAAIAAWLIYHTIDGRRAAERALHCEQCGARFDRYVDWPTEIGGVFDRTYYCPNDHRKKAGRRSAFGGESTGDRLGGWSP